MAVKNTTAAQEGKKAAEVEKNTQTAEKAQETAQNAAGEVAETVQLVYVGPSLPKGQLKQNSIFVGTRKEIEKELEKVLEKFPLIKNLLVPVSELAEAKEKTQKATTIMHKWYADVQSLAAASYNNTEGTEV